MILLCLFWQENKGWSHLNEPFDRKDGDDHGHGQACGIGVQQTEPLDSMNIYNINAFYRTQVSLGSGLWVPVSLTTYIQELWLRLC